MASPVTPTPVDPISVVTTSFNSTSVNASQVDPTSADPTSVDTTLVAVETLNPGCGYKLHPKVALRPEPFGALAYHYGNRKLVFLKSPRMVALVRDLGSFATLDLALTAAGLTDRSRPKYLAALNSLAQSDMLVPTP
jgi:mycofactocin biosynthesis protein MftB